MVSEAEEAPAGRPPEAPEPPPPARPEAVTWQSTRVSKTLWPPQAGTKRWVATHGDRVVCVRYRHDGAAKMRYTTVEVVVDCGPVRSPRRGERLQCELDPEAAAAFTAQALAEAGAQWDEAKQVWRVTRAVERRLGVEPKLRKARRRGTP